MSILKAQEKKEQPPELAKVVELPIRMIKPNPDQPRKHFPPDSLTGLAKSISQDGIVQPLTVRKSGEGYVLVSGERRLRAAALAGCTTVPCVVVHISDKRSAVVALVENIQRAELDCFEEAEAIASLTELYSMSRDEVCLRLGLAQSTVSNKLRLLRFSAKERRLFAENGLTERVRADMVFLAVGLEPQNGPFADLVSLDLRGYADAGEDCMTSTPGLFAAGDCRRKRIRQVATAASDGAVAALAACDYLDGR